MRSLWLPLLKNIDALGARRAAPKSAGIVLALVSPPVTAFTIARRLLKSTRRAPHRPPEAMPDDHRNEGAWRPEALARSAPYCSAGRHFRSRSAEPLAHPWARVRRRHVGDFGRHRRGSSPPRD